MELLFESRREIVARKGRLIPFQNSARVSAEPVLLPDSEADGGAVAIYGTVLREGGGFRMWYQAAPRSHSWDRDFSHVAHAESDDGIVWRKTRIAGPIRPSRISRAARSARFSLNGFQLR